jgi:hypothetical protein
LCLLALAAGCLAGTGCVQRRMTIRTNPPGALVYVDNDEIGTTPCSTDFIYYGTREIRLIKDGYETVVVQQPIRAPFYQWFGLDFVSENLIPFELRDQQNLDFQLRPQVIVPEDEILARANQLRQSGAPPPAATSFTPTAEVIPLPPPEPGP